MRFEALPEDVLDVLISVMDGQPDITLPYPGEDLIRPAVMLSETMTIAMLEHRGSDKFEVTHLHCYAPAHGTHPKFSQIAQKLDAINKRQNAKIVCPMCTNTGWLPAGRAEAITAASMAISLGVFRGVTFPKGEVLTDAQSRANERAFGSVLDHPLVTRIRTEMENQEGNEEG